MDLSAATDEKCTSIPNVDLLGRRDCASMVPQCFVYVCLCIHVYISIICMHIITHCIFHRMTIWIVMVIRK